MPPQPSPIDRFNDFAINRALEITDIALLASAALYGFKSAYEAYHALFGIFLEDVEAVEVAQHTAISAGSLVIAGLSVAGFAATDRIRAWRHPHAR